VEEVKGRPRALYSNNQMWVYSTMYFLPIVFQPSSLKSQMNR